MKLRMLLFIFALGLMNIPVNAQLKYEATHQDDLISLTLDNGEMKYVSYQKANNTVVLYNDDHSEWKSLPLTIPRNQYFDELKSISVHVFNTDPLIELAYTCVEYVANNETEATTEYVDVRHNLFIINEEGKLVLETENSNRLEIVDNSGTRKLWVYRETGTGAKGMEQVDVYALPDAPISDLPVKQGDQGEFRASGDRHGF